MSNEMGPMRWDPYVLSHGDDFSEFWAEYLAARERNVLFIAGCGFDVRALAVSQAVLKAGGVGQRDLWLLCFDNGLPDSDQTRRKTNANEEGYRSLFLKNQITKLKVGIGGPDKPTATSRNTKRLIEKQKGSFKAYTDIILDMSAMPRIVALTAIAQLTALLDDMAAEDGVDVDFHVTTAESIMSDRHASSGSLSDVVTHIVGFSGSLNAGSDEYLPRVWLPVLGENQNDRLRLIREELRPDEICPVIPFPSREPRRGDEIIASYRQILFDDFQVEPRNILHACEFNPFEAYKQVFGAINRYHSALLELGGCKVYVSPLSSKLLSVGALLACYDHKFVESRDHSLSIGMLCVEAVSYGDVNQSSGDPSELHSMWIRGDWEK